MAGKDTFKIKEYIRKPIKEQSYEREAEVNKQGKRIYGEAVVQDQTCTNVLGTWLAG